MSVGQPTEDRGQQVYEALQRLTSDRRDRDLELGALLVETQDNRFWEGRAETWREFLASPEINITDTRARQLIRIHRTYVEQLEFTFDELRHVPRDTLDRLHAHVKDKTKEIAQAFLDRVDGLAQADVKAVCRELGGGEVIEPDRIERAIVAYNQCVRRIKARLTPEEMILVREHKDREPL
ncbi:MAG: hypothetical protein KJ621_18450 [Proteobacteria bacterium]|nr:hypothetical protein [Pseudomonadota bacterium]